jgi:hypothetical protein
LLVLYSGPDEVDAWLDALLDSVAGHRVKATGRVRGCRGFSRGGHDAA